MVKKLSLFLILLFALQVFAQIPVESPQQKQQRLQWWTDARFGMFIHWGTYAMAARHEWVKNRERMKDERYQIYFDLFDPDMYNPQEWAKAAKDAGMKYMVITAKHHEGFCLWDTEYTDYKAPNTPCGKDLLKPMLDAYRAEGLRVGLYYSLIDWHHPEYPVDSRHPMRDNKEFREKTKDRDMDVYVEYMKNQLTELLTDYGQIDLLFMDFSFPGKDGKGHDDWHSKELLSLIRKLQPNVIVNDRLDLLDTPGGWDFRTPEQFMPKTWVNYGGKEVPWETCQTFSGSWGYYRDEYSWKDPKQLVTMLIETTSKGGNLLLNVGPTARGNFDDRAMDRLDAMGEWLKYHGRSIYGCTAAPEGFEMPQNCMLTYNPELNRMYVHVLAWPFRYIHLPGFKGKVKYAQLLNDASELEFSDRGGAWMSGEGKKDNTLTLEIPVKAPNVTVPVIELFLND